MNLTLPAALTEEQRAACAPLEAYCAGHASGDPAFMRRAFLPTARIESLQNGAFTSWDIDTYCKRFSGQPAADEAQRSRAIDWVEVAGDAGCARVTLRHGAVLFTDYFVLLKTAEGWRIANKAFHGEPAPAG